MAALVAYNPTLIDWGSRLDPDGNIAQIIEILNETNEVITDMTWLEGNLPTGHRTTIRTGLPTPTWRKLYGGVQPSKSTVVQVTDNCGMLEAYSEVDVALADLNGNTQAFRLSEDRAHIEGMNQSFADTLFYGDESAYPERFTGLAPRVNSTTAENACNIIQTASTGGGTAYSSIFLVGWGPNTVHGIFPKGQISGLQVTDKGQVTVEQAVAGTVGRFEAYRTHYKWNCGLSVRDWRYVVRIQVDTGELVKNAASGADLIDHMAAALELIPSLSSCRPVFYMNRTTKGFLRRQITNKVASSTLMEENVAGKPVMSFGGVPVRRCDALTNAETVIS